MTETLRGWASYTTRRRATLGIPDLRRVPTGPAHARHLGTMVALCGQKLVIDDGVDWPGHPHEQLCPECELLAPAPRHTTGT